MRVILVLTQFFPQETVFAMLIETTGEFILYDWLLIDNIYVLA